MRATRVLLPLVLGAVLLVATALFWHGLRDHMTVMRLVVMNNTDDVVTPDGGACTGTPSQSADTLKLLQSVIVPNARLDYGSVPLRTYDEASRAVAGGGKVAPLTLQLALFCKLRAAGIAARFVSAITTPLTSQHLDMIEAKTGGHWILLDPVTGGVVENTKGVLLGAGDVRRALYDGGFRDIRFHSFAADAADREASGNGQLHKFHYNVIAVHLFGLATLQRLPPWRFIDGATGVIDHRLLDGHNEDIALQQLIYAGVVLAMPLAGLLLLAIGALFAWRLKRGRPCR
jgi:hypothetical protein